MIKTMSVAVCDICGFTEKAKVVGSQYNEEIYGIPDGYRRIVLKLFQDAG